MKRGHEEDDGFGPERKVLKRKEKWPDWVLEADSGKKLVPKRFKDPIAVCRAPPAPERGRVRVLKIHGRFAKVDPELKKWPAIEGYERHNVCKNNRYGELSPMLLGPICVDGELYGLNIEDSWQCSKVLEILSVCSV